MNPTSDISISMPIYFDLRPEKQQLGWSEIRAALEWAKRYLGIKGDIAGSFSVLFVNPFDNRLGWYDPVAHFISFNGFPTLETVFHEAAHWEQHERGVDFEEVAASMKTEYPHSRSLQYTESPIEREARWRSWEMRDAYMERST